MKNVDKLILTKSTENVNSDFFNPLEINENHLGLALEPEDC